MKILSVVGFVSFLSVAESAVYFYGFEFDPKAVKSLIDVGERFYEYLKGDAAMWEEYKKHMEPTLKNDPNYLNRGYSKGHDELHVTTFFGDTPETLKKYSDLKAVKEAQNKAFDLKIIGVMITPRTLGFRMALPAKSLDLWSVKDNEPPINDPQCNNEFCHERLKNSSIDPFSPGDFKKGSRAHATVLTNSKTGAVQTGLDLCDVMYCEKACAQNRMFRPVDFEPEWTARMRYYGFGRFVFYLNTPFEVKSIFKEFTIDL